ncbi:E3 SUMO-protein ligase pli1 [Ophidiomyces ophidiicola]|nr:E3 SUMO-protein ligase pli1 [Ophidiomyces ophidiicola]
MPTPPQPYMQHVTALVKSLLNAQLKVILRNEHLPVSGVKHVLQLRILNHIQSVAHIPAEFERLKASIYFTAKNSLSTTPDQSPSSHPMPSHTPTQPLPTPRPAFSTTITPPYSTSTGIYTLPPFQKYQIRSDMNIPVSPIFKESPFYTILEPLTSVAECKIRETARDVVELKFHLTESVAARFQTESDLRVMVYCTADTGLNQYSKSDISFPHQVELKVNLDEVKTNLRGLKNKPGTTRPADITNFVRKKAGYVNHKFFVIVNLVKKHSVEELVEKLKSKPLITTEQVIREMKSKAEDTDIVATSSIMSLKCPLSTLRIAIPCRTVLCSHSQCFDAVSFLQLQEQAPTWTCPVCNKLTSFEGLQIDQYFDDILKSTSTDTDQVTIEPNGEWSKPGDRDPTTETQAHTPALNDDDDLIEIQESRLLSLKQELSAFQIPLPPSITPTPSSREASLVSPARVSTNKRSASQVIDLTGSDDEEPPRPAKRPTLPNSASLNGFRRQSYDYRVDANYRSSLSNSNSNY